MEDSAEDARRGPISCSLYDEVSAKGQPSAEFPCPPTPICSRSRLDNETNGRSPLAFFHARRTFWSRCVQIMVHVQRITTLPDIFNSSRFRISDQDGNDRRVLTRMASRCTHWHDHPRTGLAADGFRKTDAVHSTDHRVRAPQWAACTQCAAIQPASAARGGLPHSRTASHVPPHDWPTRTGWHSERTTRCHPVIPPGPPDDLSIVDKPSMERDVDRPSIFRRRIVLIAHLASAISLTMGIGLPAERPRETGS